MTREPWRGALTGHALTTRECEIQLMLACTSVQAPRSQALDAQGRACGFPAHLMSRCRSGVDADRVDEASLDRLADVLATMHEVSPTCSGPATSSGEL
jgi:aminoglycoside phosphotransferase (APT) family kinase protein